MVEIKRTTSHDLDFVELVKGLDQDLALKNGDKNDFFVQFNTVDLLDHVVIIYDNCIAVGCGAIKEYTKEVAEVKRMFVLPESRGLGFSKLVIDELQTWAKELGYQKCILETGDKMKEAIGLYQKIGFHIIPNYAPYENETSSICFEKTL